MVGSKSGDRAAVVALARLHDPLARARRGEAPALPRGDRLVEVEVVRRRRVILALARRGGGLEVALVLDDDRVRRVPVDVVLGDAGMEGVPARLALGGASSHTSTR